MSKLKKIPEAEFEVMKIVWANEPPLTTAIIMEQIKNDKKWKVQTVITLLNRLVERGFLRSEKSKKELRFYPLIEKEEYLKFETDTFLKQYHDSSFLNLVNALYEDKSLTDDEIKELDGLLRKAKEKKN